MAKAIVPSEMPPVPEEWTGWRRSKRAGSMYHLHSFGATACGSLVLYQFKSEAPRHLGDMQFWGVCPRCMRKAK